MRNGFKCPIIIMSGKMVLVSDEEIRNLGVIKIIQKPFDTEALIDSIRTFLI